MPADVIYGNFCRSWEGWGVGRVMVLARGKEEYSGHDELVGGPNSLKIMEMSSISPFAWKSGSLRRSSANMQPTDHRSTAVE
jgi:hypothetical protein